jgi:hypothetical protein
MAAATNNLEVESGDWAPPGYRRLSAARSSRHRKEPNRPPSSLDGEHNLGRLDQDGDRDTSR